MLNEQMTELLSASFTIHIETELSEDCDLDFIRTDGERMVLVVRLDDSVDEPILLGMNRELLRAILPKRVLEDLLDALVGDISADRI
jgi:hypothetical protein